jgi:hypothetical protein
MERYYSVTGRKKQTKCPPERAFHFSKSLTFGGGKVPLANMPSLEYQENVTSKSLEKSLQLLRNTYGSYPIKFLKPTEIDHGG